MGDCTATKEYKLADLLDDRFSDKYKDEVTSALSDYLCVLLSTQSTLAIASHNYRGYFDLYSGVMDKIGDFCVSTACKRNSEESC